MEAAKKKHDAIETDIAAYEERVQSLVNISKELEAERYHDAKRIDVRKDNVLRLWDYLQELLKARRVRLHKNLTLQRIFQEMLHIISWMDDMKVQRRSWRGSILTTFTCLRFTALIFCIFRHGFCRPTLGNTCWRSRTCCRNTHCWRMTLRCRRSACRVRGPLPCSSPMEIVSLEKRKR